MKCYEKKLPGFSIIYLHNPSKCYKCTQMEKYENMNRTYEKKKIFVRRKRFDEKILDPVKTISFKTGVEQESLGEPEFEFQKPFENIYPVKPLKKIILKKKNFNIPSETSCATSGDFSKKNSHVKKNFAKLEKKSKVEKMMKYSPGKKQTSSIDKKVKGSKVPGKGTLKRKRWFLNKLNDNDNYEDDMFEDKKFGHFQNLLEDETDSCEKYEELQTPVFPFSISPRADSPSPTYKDCYSPTELNRSRKGAEEYHYRRGRRKKQLFSDKKNEATRDSERRETNVEKTLEAVARILNERQSQIERTSDSDDDQYFSDVLENSSKAFS